ncbi:amidohydrolase [Sporosarcina aquimarina]|uniref:Amidohydrolase n=1 Tax=Sporosarcina aquimarina TaxID=114975 RepID=A0ABU4FZA1_9BACL|nr:amidohydrolase [Sporosarcina aquimarina]MDW0110049.1 amidohydrolase [Sporosarcina aquimarina]
MKTIWHNGIIYTMERENETVEAVLTEAGTVLETGSYDALQQLADNEVDLRGAVMYPGFIDSHMHMIGHGDRLLQLDLSYATSAEDMLGRLRVAAQNHPEGEWFTGDGWNENNFADHRIVSKFELDAISTSPMYLKRTCRHASLANSKALELAGIAKDTPNPDNGTIVRDESGEATGLLLEGAADLVEAVIPVPDEASLTRALQASVEDLLSRGITGAVTDDLGYYGDYSNPLQAFRNVIGEDKLKFRAHLLRRSTVFQSLMENGATYDEPWIHGGEMKFFIDGALGGRTALLSKPYSDDPGNSGMAVLTDEEIDKNVKLARNYGEAVAVHTIGDKALEKLLDVLEVNPPAKGKKDRIIHVNVLSDELVDRMEKLPVILDIQPVFVPSDFPWAKERLGEERMDWAYAWKKLIDKGFVCGGGSDAPVEEVDPLLGIYAAATRRKPGESHEGYLPDEKLSRYESVALFTSGSAATMGKADSRGKIFKGFDADFTILDRDLMTVDSEAMLKAQTVMTVVAGDIIYKR